MKSRKKYDDIYKKIQHDTKADLPESLQPAAIAALVKDTEQAKKKHRTARIVSVSAAAVLVAVLAGVGGVRLFNHTPMVETPQTPQQSVSADLDDAHLRSAADYKEIEDYFAALQAEYKAQTRGNVWEDTVRLFGAQKYALTNEIADGAVAESFNGGNALAPGAEGATTDTATGTAASHGETNTQVENIDEADILKNDGEYLYLVQRADTPCVEILDIRDRTKITLAAAAQLPAANEGERISVSEIYVRENTLVVLAAVYNDAESGGMDYARGCYAYSVQAARTLAAIFDISDRSAPALLNTYAVDGSLLSSRMDGDTLLLLTNYNVPIYKDETDMKNACVPCYYKDGEKTRFPVNDVKLPENTDDTAYLTVSLIDTQNPAETPAVKAVLGGGSDIYCDGDTLLAVRTETEANISEVGDTVTYSMVDMTTRLYAFDLTDGVCYKGSAKIQGTVLNQFSMDAYNGYYRIATTAQDGCIITVLNRDLETVGVLSGIAKGEDIYAARFMGDTAYLVTFYQTDPLFVVDLSNPEAPEIKGELKIPGFSNYLHPYGEGLLIGVGQDGTDSRATNQVKISLFDVSDKENPKEISKLVYGGNSGYSYSAAQYDHKAYLTFSDSGEFAVPIYEYNTRGTNTAYASAVTVENGELKITNTYTPEARQNGETYSVYSDEIQRVTYSGDTVYTLSDAGLTAFDRASGEILCTYSTPQYEEAIAE
ncbi:MAG: beta-propeller domain-containing protein [Clostridia bacterium]|nr:beta-propeller domain-containing protein [Clostridia bacterium]